MDEISNSDYGFGLGLEFDRAAVEDGIEPNHKGKFDSTPDLFYLALGLIDRDIPKGQFNILHDSAKRRWRDCLDYRPKNLKESYEKELNEWGARHPLTREKLP
jgi:hypothetical protein